MKTKTKVYVSILFVSILLFSSVISYHVGLARFSGSLDSQNRYFDATLPCSYVIDANSTHTFCFNGTTHKLDESSSSNRSLPIQNAINNITTNGGLIFVKSGNYSDASVTVTNNVVLLLEVGVTGLTYTTTGTGIVLKYASGYAFIDASLNMTGHQIVNGIFHSGSTPPTSPTEGQPFYDTDDHTLYVWNSTDWVSSLGSGSTHDTHQDYDYYIWKDETKFYAKNGTTEQVEYESTDFASVFQSCIDTIDSIGTFSTGFIIFGYGVFTATSDVYYQTTLVNLKLQGEGARYSTSYLGDPDHPFGTQIYFNDCNFWGIPNGNDLFSTVDTGGSSEYFVDAERTETNNYWYYGSVRWLNGSNAGRIHSIKANYQANNTIVLWSGTSTIQAGDAYVICRNGIWNNGHNVVEAKDISFYFNGGSTADNTGLWICPVTRPMLTDCSLIVNGQFKSNSDGMFGRGSGASGTVRWENVIIHDLVDSSSFRVFDMNYDMFFWDGGMMQFDFGSGVSGHYLIKLETTAGAEFNHISSWTGGGGDAESFSYFMFSPIDINNFYPTYPNGQLAYVLNDVYFSTPSDVKYHFDSTAGTLMVDVTYCYPYQSTFKTDGNVGVYKTVTSFSGISNGSYVDIRDRGLKLGGTPDIVIPSAMNATVWYGATNSTHVQIYGSNATLTGSVYCEYKP